jgi:hypothetical protein
LLGLLEQVFTGPYALIQAIEHQEGLRALELLGNALGKAYKLLIIIQARKAAVGNGGG